VPRQKIRGSAVRNCAQLWLRARGCKSFASRVTRELHYHANAGPPDLVWTLEARTIPNFFPSPFFVTSQPGYRRSIFSVSSKELMANGGGYRDKLRLITSTYRINFINYTCNRCNYKRHLLSRITLQRLWVVFNWSLYYYNCNDCP